MGQRVGRAGGDRFQYRKALVDHCHRALPGHDDVHLRAARGDGDVVGGKA